MVELDAGEFLLMQLDHLLAPEHAGLQHVGLVDRTDLAPARTCQLESRTCDAADLAGSVLLGVEAAALPVGQRFDTARFAKIDAAGEFADNDEVDAFQHMRL